MLDRLVARAATLVTHTEPPRLFTELGVSPRLFRAWLPFGSALLLQGALPRADSELVILRTAFNCTCQYEWAHHVRLARRAGLPDEEIIAVAGGEGAGLWSERQRLLLRATDELHADRRIDPATAARLAGVLSERQLVELCLLVGHYEMLAMVLKTRGTAPEPGAIRHLDPRTAAIGETLSTVISGPEADTAGRPTLVTPGGSDLRL